MKVLLIDPPLEPLHYTMKGDHSLGLGYVAAILEQIGAEVHILEVPDRSAASTEAVLNAVAHTQANVVGLTSILFKHQEALRLARAVKAAFADVLIVMGGPYVTHAAAETLRDEPAVDLIVLGEAEQTLQELELRLADRRAWSGVKGLAFRDGHTLHLEPGRSFIEDLDRLPFPARRLFAGIETEDSFSVLASRGCPYTCVYCQSSVYWGRRWRARSAGNVAAEVQQLLEQFDVRQFIFVDDLFTRNAQRVHDLCEALCRLPHRSRWACQTRVDLVTTPMLSDMARAGCRLVIFGVESPSQQGRDVIRKGITEAQVARACRMAREAGLRTELGFIIGLPGDDESTADNITAFVQRVAPDWITAFPLAVFPGTDLFSHPERYPLMGREHSLKVRDRVLASLYPRYAPPYAVAPRPVRVGLE